MFRKTLIAVILAAGLITGIEGAARAGIEGGAVFSDISGSRLNTQQYTSRQSTRAVPTTERARVIYTTKYKPGSLIVDTRAKYLYLVEKGGTALRYGIGSARPGFEWGGDLKISRKTKWPTWTPPPNMRKREPWLPIQMPGGPENPLGARALYLGSTLYRIHGTNQGTTIGRSVSSGCIRLHNKDVMDLFERVRVGARVVVLR